MTIAAGCQHMGPLTPKQYAHATAHSVFINQDGHAMVPDTAHNARVVPPTDSIAFARYVGGIMDSIRRSGRDHVLLRIHGGMNSLREQVDTNLSITSAIYTDSAPGSASIYPVYVNWESSLKRSYVDHLLHVRQGHSYRGFHPMGWGLVPFYLTADVGRAVTRTPLLWSSHITSFWGSGASKADRLGRDSLWSVSASNGAGEVARPCDRSDENARRPRANPEQVAIELCPYLPTRREVWLDRAIVLAAPLPLVPILPYPRNAAGGRAKYFSAPLPKRLFGTRIKLFSPWMAERVSLLKVPPAPFAVIFVDAFGTPGYANMQRRTKTMFRDANEFSEHAAAKGRQYRRPTGALTLLVDSLNALVQNSVGASDSLALCWGKVARDTVFRTPHRIRLTIVAHSMGAAIAGPILRNCPGLVVDNIVFMAPAQSINDFVSDVLPYLAAHPDSRFYLLTLHPMADRREASNGKPYLVHGSLLTWLDGYISHPQTDGDRMLGRFENIIAALHLIPDSVRRQIYIKGFGYRGDQLTSYAGGMPYMHSHFNEVRTAFWRCDFWTPAVALRDCRDRQPR